MFGLQLLPSLESWHFQKECWVLRNTTDNELTHFLKKNAVTRHSRGADLLPRVHLWRLGCRFEVITSEGFSAGLADLSKSCRKTEYSSPCSHTGISGLLGAYGNCGSF